MSNVKVLLPLLDNAYAHCKSVFYAY